MNTPQVICKTKELGSHQFRRLKVIESLGDDLPIGELVFLVEEEDMDLNIPEITNEVMIGNDTQLTLKAFVDSASGYRGENTWKLTFVPKDFYQTPKVQEFDGIKNLVKSLCPYDLKSQIDSDANLDNIKLYQNNITDYKFLIKYLKALKKNTAYAFGFDGLTITDLTNPVTRDISIKSFSRNIPLKVIRNKFLELKSSKENLNDNGISVVHYNNDTISVPKEFSQAYENYLESQLRYTALTDGFSYPFPTYMDLRAGDLVKITGTEFQKNNYIVVRNELDLTTGGVVNTLTFASL